MPTRNHSLLGLCGSETREGADYRQEASEEVVIFGTVNSSFTSRLIRARKYFVRVANG